SSELFIGADINLYYDGRHPQWYKRPDWFLVLGVNAAARQEDLRWSYVVWQEGINPFLVVELLSPGTEDEDLGGKVRELGRPPLKWEVYEKILRVPFYVVYDRYENQLRVFTLVGSRYQSIDLPDSRFWFEDLDMGIAIWAGAYQGVEGQWLRWYDREGQWIPTDRERLATESEARQIAEQQVQSAIPRLARMGLTAAQIAEALSLQITEVEQQLPIDR
ncbi:MAG: Uma2 family endonuclease, partial [Synechococcales bacterium]|nr:Uma2 family endonuclease [Synechococcales bacterium]